MTKMKIAKKANYIIISILFILLFGLSYLNFAASKKNAINSIQQENMVMLNGIISSVENFLCERKCDIEELTMLIDEDRTAVQKYMLNDYKKHNRYKSIAYIDIDGNYIYRVADDTTAPKTIFEEYQDETLVNSIRKANETKVSQISRFYKAKDNELIISVVSPVINKENIVGYVVGNVKSEAVGEEIIYINLKNTGKTVFGVDEKSVRVFSLYKGFIGDSVFDKSNRSLNDVVINNYTKMTKGEAFSGEHFNALSSEDYNVVLEEPEKRYIVSKPLIIDNDFKLSIAIVSPQSIANFVDWFTFRQLSLFILLNIVLVYVIYIAYRDYKENERLQESLIKSQESERIKTEFFCNMSHELRTPLTIILSSLHFVFRKYESVLHGNEELGKIYTKIRQNCFRLLKIINNLLEISRFDAGNVNRDLRNTDIVKLVEDIVMSSVFFGRQKNIDITFDTEFEEKIIAVDEDGIERVVLNLLSNAIKFTPRNGEILVNITGDEDFINISVKDNGIGIPKDKEQLIFERFIQINNPLRKYAEGTGIGLSLVKSIVEMHNGKIDVISEEGKGSEFIVRLPNITVEEAAVQEIKKLDDDIINKINIEFSDIQ